ncbi:hypothetical protein RGU72_15200 [Undibacterium sp. 5I1]|uniref:hypothetical protein n=1 Tax=unclassified Undibacterium TaxID=2630295 RepID=UPI002AB497CE|nr:MULTISPECIES: hypothetical protein [unclassified Undibacterium]MDY7539598.1 hypothetical protein [Undibacterium sp. 5I1]MEB0230451.1 hypothetical protein [Undibacterium sp. 10I3]MEB0258487.1 hypothetical protein [Undibacterium sp. 5I1]
MPDDIDEKWKSFADLHNYYQRLRGAETHWFFVEAEKALRHGLHIAAVLSFINGIEASIRTNILYQQGKFDEESMSTVDIMKNALLRDAQLIGLRVEILAFPGEVDFEEKLKSKKKPVELVRVRNNLCHGNVFEYFKKVPDTGETIFTSECLQDLALILKDISEKWSKEIERFKELQ